ncbi:MAG: hypothetical protein CMK09_18375 [Ponticaulis sp.]|nr:hypothetical protein [Ponticaulis sp.]
MSATTGTPRSRLASVSRRVAVKSAPASSATTRETAPLVTPSSTTQSASSSLRGETKRHATSPRQKPRIASCLGKPNSDAKRACATQSTDLGGASLRAAQANPVSAAKSPNRVSTNSWTPALPSPKGKGSLEGADVARHGRTSP